MTELKCRYCPRPIDLNSTDVMQRIEGWEDRVGVRVSGKHGGSDIWLRERQQEFAHRTCVSLARKGLLRQESLL
jgi:hypothetical protein